MPMFKHISDGLFGIISMFFVSPENFPHPYMKTTLTMHAGFDLTSN